MKLANALPEDALVFTDTANIHGTYTGGTLTLTGTDTQAAYQAALRSVRYVNNSQNPDTTARTITFAASDGTDASAPATKTVAVVAVDDPTTVSSSSGATTFTEDGGAVVIDGGAHAGRPGQRVRHRRHDHHQRRRPARLHRHGRRSTARSAATRSR